jgi:hypothetical protein
MAASDDHGVDKGDAGQPGRTDSTPRLFRRLHPGAGPASRDFPVPSWVRWIAASLAVVVDWLVSGMQDSPRPYVFLLLFIALMLYPDAQAISVAGLSFERLRTEVHRQDERIAALSQQLNIVNSHQEITIKLAAGEQAPRLPWDAAAPQYRAASQEAPDLPSRLEPPDVSSEGDEAGPEPPCTPS